MAARTPLRRLALLGSALAGLTASPAALAQMAAYHGPAQTPVSKTDPVYYQADATQYDRDAAFVTLTGHVEIWQGDRVLRADKVTYDRNTGVAAATGHVTLLDPNGQVVFADYAELSQGMKDGVLANLRARLADNGQLAATGARRTDAQINELSRAVYSTCNLCKQHPEEPALWDIRAESAVQDIADKRIEYRDAVLDIYGLPVAWFPYLTHPDPSAKRASGLLVPSFGYSKHLGAFTEVPYYWAVDEATDATITPILASHNGPAVEAQIRHVFNNGKVTINTSVANDNDRLGDDIFANGVFAIDDEWRWGFDLQRASTINYMRDFHLSGVAPVLTSQIYLEGFGQGAYARLDARAYQGLSGSAVSARFPYVLPRYEYSFSGEPDALGGRLSADAEAFNVSRQVGTNTERVSLRANWERPVNGAIGDLWKLVLHADAAGYTVHQLDQAPTFGPRNVAGTGQSLPSAAVEVRWPLERDAGGWGTQVIEPVAQLILAPNGSSYGVATRLTGATFLNSLVPNEDSLDFDFTDASLFALNRFPGVDRLEGGNRVNVALHTAWYFPDKEQIDAQIGQGYRQNPAPEFPVGSGLNGTVTDIVSHVSYLPNKWFDINTQQRFDHDSLQLRFADVLASGGPEWLRLSGGYLFSSFNPFNYYDTVPSGVLEGTPRREISLGMSTRYGQWRFAASARRDVALNKMVAAAVGGAYENECFIFDVEFNRRYVSLGNDTGASALLFQLTFKTVGTIGFNGL